MASFTASSLVSCTKVDPLFSRSRDLIKIPSTNLPIRSTKLTVKAVKFKGTQMREQKLTEMIENKILEAKKLCEEDEKSDGCKVAWDEVEEVSQAKADFRKKLEIQDPLEYFCTENPETDECRIYED